jgi:signal peptidase II
MLVLIIFLFFYAIKINKKIYYFAFSLIIGGAIGNLIDRFLYQAVLDFIDIHYMNYHWYVFNFADITITVGCLLVIILELFSGKNKKENA